MNEKILKEIDEIIVDLHNLGAQLENIRESVYRTVEEERGQLPLL